MNLDEAIAEAVGRVTEPPPPGALVVVQGDGTVASLIGQPGQQLVIGDDGMPAYADPPAPAGSDETTEVAPVAADVAIDAQTTGRHRL